MEKVSATAFEFEYSVVDTSDNSTTVHNGQALLRKVIVSTVLSAHTVLVKDGTTTLYTIPASAAVGTEIDFGDLQVSSLVIDPDDASTGGLLVVFKPRIS